MLSKTYLMLVTLIPVLVYANTELPDPTRPANFIVETDEPVLVEVFSESSKEQITWSLSAVRISDNDKTAIINGKLVREGDEINQAKVLEIKSKSVLIDHENNKLLVRLFNDYVIKNYKSEEKNREE